MSQIGIRVKNSLSVSQSFSIPLLPQWVAGKLVPISSSLWVGGGVHFGQVASPSQGTQTTMHTLIHTERPINLKGMSLDCGRKPEYPVRTLRMHGENMQTPCRKTPSRESDPGPSCCKATVLPAASPCSTDF
ncbi:hypothetical protein AMECASPLE_010542 [Ameca splendens]|uniref:Uncharacterized protein n=1 Tax=Ameca splendens TaxID=208324 RepID=A0ABV0ZLL3_9TELE